MAILGVVPVVATAALAVNVPQWGKEARGERSCGLQARSVAGISWSSATSSSRELVAPGGKQGWRAREAWVLEAAWTRRSKGQPSKNRKSWKQRTEKFFKPFILDVFISSKYVHAKVMHRVTSNVVSVATTNAKDLRNSLPSLIDMNACKLIGQLIAERCIEADVYAVAFDLRKNEKLEGKLAIVIDSAIEHGLTLV